MPRTRTLAQLRAEVRDRADIENSDHITDATITRYVNQSGAALHAMLVEHCQDEFITRISSTTAAPTDNVVDFDLGTTVYKVVAVHLEVGGRVVHLDRWDWRSGPIPFDPTVTGPPYTYRVTGDDVRIFPAPPVGTRVQAFIVPAYVDLSLDADTLDGRDGWEEWIIWDAAIKCMVKEETDTREAVAERDRVLSRVMSQMKSRDMAHPHRVVDVDPIDREWPYPWGVPR